MLIVSPNTASAIAPHAHAQTWVMFVQVNPPGGGAGPIRIALVPGKQIASELRTLEASNPFEVMLIGLATSPQPGRLAEDIATQFADDHIRDGWFIASPDLIGVIQAIGQQALQDLLGNASPGSLPSNPVDTEGMAEILDCSVQTVRRMVARGQIPYMRTGRLLRFVPSDVLASLRRGR
jgi:excisionase family DNA binding protein